MIETKNRNSVPYMRETWKKGLPNVDPRFMEYFFGYVYKPEYGYYMMEEDEVKGSLCCIPHAYMFNGRVLQASIISKIAIPNNRQKLDVLDSLMDVVLDRCDHQELLTLLEPEDTTINYSKYGFEGIYERIQYTLRREDIKQSYSNLGCSFDPSAVDMLKVYVGFIKRFNGFFVRDIEYYTKLKREINARGGKIVAFYNSKNKIEGYATILIEGKTARIEECVYLESTALMKLINAAFQERGLVYLEVSPFENLSLVFPEAEKKSVRQIYARLNNPELFSRLYNTEVRNIHDAFMLSKKPLNLNEIY